MALLEIKKYPDFILRKKSKKVDDFSNDGLKKIIKNMIETMYKNDGVGLAAPQVGINRRFFVVDIGHGPMSLINPSIIKKSNKYVKDYEGCLSLPGVSIMVNRVTSIELEAYLLEKKQFVKIKAENLLARVLQHELDHINGVLIVDYERFWKRKRALKKLKEMQD